MDAFRSEGQLLGVLGYEIGHNVANHIGRRKAKSRNSNIVATAATILVGNRNLGDTIRLRDQVNIHAFTRDLELEADMLGILKEQSDYVSTASG